MSANVFSSFMPTALPSMEQTREVTALEEQADLIRLAPGKTYRNTWTIEVHE